MHNCRCGISDGVGNAILHGNCHRASEASGNNRVRSFLRPSEASGGHVAPPWTLKTISTQMKKAELGEFFEVKL